MGKLEALAFIDENHEMTRDAVRIVADAFIAANPEFAGGEPAITEAWLEPPHQGWWIQGEPEGRWAEPMDNDGEQQNEEMQG